LLGGKKSVTTLFRGAAAAVEKLTETVASFAGGKKMKERERDREREKGKMK